jgi:hypothetical protein
MRDGMLARYSAIVRELGPFLFAGARGLRGPARALAEKQERGRAAVADRFGDA